MKKRRLIRWLLFAPAIAALIYATILYLTLPDVRSLAAEAPVRTRYMPSDHQLRFVPLEEISPLAICAVIKAEDKKFFRHGGFDWEQIERAIRGRISRERSIGGSTITQQLARNLYLTREQSFHRKIREALIARELEVELDKRRILELYLSAIEWGPGVWGISEASEYYFRKKPGELDVFESIFLVGLIAAPARKLEGANLDRAMRVQHRVLGQLEHAGLVSAAEVSECRAGLRQLAEHLARGDSLEIVLQARSPASAPQPALDDVLRTCGEDRVTATATSAPDRAP